MKVPINWLRDYVDFADERDLVELLTSVGHMQDGPPVRVGDTNIYDLEVRQNRSDCLSMIGIAREAAAVYGVSLRDPYQDLKSIPSVKSGTTIIIEDKSLCYRFNTVTIEGIKVGESPKWIQDKLAAYGVKTINNVVDITNFVMIEIGEPLHAWDAAKVKNREVILRRAKKGERFTALGNKEIELTTDDLIATDSEKVLSLAGVIGGEKTGVTNQTTEIILEDATYNQAAIRRSSIRHSIRTEASTRHEKFLHPRLAELALSRATELILKYAGGTIVDHTDAYPTKVKDIDITLRLERLNLVGGVTLTANDVADIFRRLQLSYKVVKNAIIVNVPYFRTDLTQEDDLIEEVLRIRGYSKIPSTLPSTPPPPTIDPPSYLLEDEIRDVMTCAGYDEQITDPLTLEVNPQLTPVQLENSLNSDKIMLRTTLKSNLLNAIYNHHKFQHNAIKLFELGKRYFVREGEHAEEKLLAVITDSVDYRTAKGIVKLLIDEFDCDFEETDITIEIIDHNSQIYFFELPLSRIRSKSIVKPLSEPPHIILEDISFFVKRDEKVGEIISSMLAKSKLLQRVSFASEYTKDRKRSITLNLEFAKKGANITREEVLPERNKLKAFLTNEYHAEVRSA